LWQVCFAVIFILMLDGSLSLGIPCLFVSCKISTWDYLVAKLAVLFALPFSGFGEAIRE
jgi:hypothetical protein